MVSGAGVDAEGGSREQRGRIIGVRQNKERNRKKKRVLWTMCSKTASASLKNPLYQKSRAGVIFEVARQQALTTRAPDLLYTYTTNSAMRERCTSGKEERGWGATRRHGHPYMDCGAAARRILLTHVSRPRRSAARHCSPASCTSQSANPNRHAAR